MKYWYQKIANSILSKLYLYGGMNLWIGSFSFKPYRRLKKELRTLELQSKESLYSFPVTKLYPIYSDREDSAGSLMLHYFYQDLHVAQRVFANNPLTHADIGSRVDGFVAHVASFRKIEVYDVRPLAMQIPNVTFCQADMMKPQSVNNESLDSISCLHALEHFGLGRYGDPICFEGYLIGLKTMTKMLKKGGRMYLSVPMGPQRIEFHAHRVFSLKYMIEMVSIDYKIEQFSYVNDQNDFFSNVEITEKAKEDNFGCTWGCGILEMIKL